MSADMDTYTASNPNSGHGHVYPRPDGALARCGGPGLCLKCAADQRRKEADVNTEAHPVTVPPSASWPPIQPGAPIAEPCIAVPADFSGTEAEAVALAVAGAVGELQRQRDAAVAMLRELVATYPETSWAQDADVKERAQALLETYGPAPEPPPPCPNHKEVQHRDRKPPWCNSCGWRRAKPGEPAQPLGTPRPKP